MFLFSKVQDMTRLNPRSAQAVILQMMDPISRTEITILSIPADPLILLLPVEDRALSKMMTVTKIQKLTSNVMGTKSTRLSLQIPPEWLLG